MNSRQNKRQKNRQKKREKPKRLAGDKRRENRKRTEKREKVSAIGRLTREMMSDVMETALKKPIQTGEFRKRPVEPAWRCPAGYVYRLVELDACTMEYLTPEDAVTGRVILQLHGGGYIGPMKNIYRRFAVRYSKLSYGADVLSVDYRVAPEHPFPTGFMDCYAVAKAIYTNRFILNVNPKRITLIGDSAGGNLVAAVSLKARDDGIFKPQRQILIYPAVNNDYSDTSRFQSVKDCGSDYLLTAGKMRDYIDFYAAREEDKKNKYFAPLMETDYRNQPDTLILTAEFDPLRDEGEEYGKRLKEAGNYVEVHRIKDALHGYFALGIRYFHVQESFELINQFLSRRE